MDLESFLQLDDILDLVSPEGELEAGHAADQRLSDDDSEAEDASAMTELFAGALSHAAAHNAARAATSRRGAPRAL